jgi:hypothetical protein
MPIVFAELPFMVADGERIEVTFADGDLVLRFVDISKHAVEYRFRNVLAFRWSARSTVETPRDDMAFEVMESAWLADEVQLDGCSKPEEFAHHVLCFNAAKVLEIISRRTG